jgi:hypothetical protein
MESSSITCPEKEGQTEHIWLKTYELSFSLDLENEDKFSAFILKNYLKDFF